MAANSLTLQVVLDMVDKVSGRFRAITESSSRLGKSLRANRDTLKMLEAQQGQLAKHRELESRAASTSQQLVQQRRVLMALQNTYNATEAPTAKLTRELRRQSDAVGKLARAEQTQRGELVQSRAALSAAGLGADRMAIHQGRLGREITQTTQRIDRQKASLERLAASQRRADGLKSAGASMAVKGAVAYAGGSMALQRMGDATMPGVQLQSQVRDIAITGGFNAQQEAALSAQIRSDAMKFGQTTEVISQGLQVLVANGVSASDDLRYYSGLLAKSSVASGAEVEDLSNLMVSLQQNLGLTREQMPGAIDALAYAGKQGSFELRDMAKWMPTLTPMMASLGVHGRDAVNQLGAALQVAKLGAGSTDEAGNNLKNFLTKISSPETLGNFKKVGIDLKKRLLELQAQGIAPMEGSLQLITEYMGKKGPEALKSLRAAMALKDNEERQQALQRVAEAYALGDLFRDQQAAAFIRPALEHGDQLKSIKQGAAAASGVLDADYLKRMETAQKKLDMFQIKLTELKLKAFDALAPSLTELADKAGGLFDKIGTFVTANPVLSSWIIKAVAGFALLLTIVGAVLVPLGFIASGIGHILTLFNMLRGMSIGARLFGAIGRIGPMLTALRGIAGRAMLGIGRFAMIAGRMILASPLGIAIGLLALAAYMVWKNWDGMKAGAILLWQDICGAVSDAWEWLKVKAGVLWEWLKQIFSWTPLGMIISNWGAIKGVFATIWEGVRAYLQGAWNVITGIFSGDGGKIRAGLQMMWDGINMMLGGWPAKLLGIGVNIVQGLISGIRSMASAVGDALAGVANGAIARVKALLGIKSPSRVFAELGGFTMAGFTQGLMGGEAGAQNALGRIGTGLRTTAAGITLGTAGMALAAPAVPPGQPVPALPPVVAQAMRVQPQVGALGALPALQASITPQLEALGPLAPLHAAATAVPVDTRPPLAMGGATPASAGRGATYNITINTAQGSNGQDIAKAVRDEIERLEHQRRVRTRAELSDYE